MDHSYTPARKTSRPTVEVTVPVKRAQSSSRVSSAASIADDASGDGTNETNTPATSAVMTPADSDVNTSRKRVSATARAQELRTGALSLGNSQRGRKRTASAMSTGPQSAERSDADLARALQFEEYGEPAPKRQKASGSKRRNVREVADSTDDEFIAELDDLSDANVSDDDSVVDWQPRRKVKTSTRARSNFVVPDSEGSPLTELDELGEQDDVYNSPPGVSESESPAPAFEVEPPVLQRSRTANAAHSRARGSGLRRRTSRPPWMSYRVSGLLTSDISYGANASLGFQGTAEARETASAGSCNVG